jgi:hypothetical protein
MSNPRMADANDLNCVPNAVFSATSHNAAVAASFVILWAFGSSTTLTRM